MIVNNVHCNWWNKLNNDCYSTINEYNLKLLQRPQKRHRFSNWIRALQIIMYIGHAVIMYNIRHK